MYLLCSFLFNRDELSSIKYTISDAAQGLEVFLQAADTSRSILRRQFENQKRHRRIDPRWNRGFTIVESCQ